jgi:hypothetical protein
MRRSRRAQHTWAASWEHGASFWVIGCSGGGGSIEFYDPNHWPFFLRDLKKKSRVDIASRTSTTFVCSVEGNLIGFNVSYDITNLFHQSAGMMGLRSCCDVHQTPQKGSKMWCFGALAFRTSVVGNGWDGSRRLDMYVLMHHVQPVGQLCSPIGLLEARMANFFFFRLFFDHATHLSVTVCQLSPLNTSLLMRSSACVWLDTSDMIFMDSLLHFYSANILKNHRTTPPHPHLEHRRLPLFWLGERQNAIYWHCYSNNCDLQEHVDDFDCRYDACRG